MSEGTAEANGLAAVDYAASELRVSLRRPEPAPLDKMLAMAAKVTAAKEQRAFERGALYGFPEPAQGLRGAFSPDPEESLRAGASTTPSEPFALGVTVAVPFAADASYTAPSPDDVANVGDALAALDPALLLVLRKRCAWGRAESPYLIGALELLGLLDAIDQLAHDLRNAQAAALRARGLLDEAKATIAALRSGATR